MNKLTAQKRIQVVAALVEGASINSVVRMIGVSKPTILKLLADLGTACRSIRMRNCVTSHVDEFRQMKSGHSVSQRIRTSLMN